ncbi:MAG TPA: ABC transporter permease [Bryobacteraceae bacterium]|nr:ABC transporter permease [Bryobacteraceae bacterium]
MTWWQRLWRRARMEEQLEKELRFHREQYIADLVAQGRSPEEARREARLVLGGTEQVKEQCRDARGTRWLEEFGRDFRYALRTLRQRPGFTMVALLTLALGCGATTVMFTLIDRVLLKPLPFPQPDRLVRVHGHTAAWNVAAYGEQNLANLDFRDCQQASRSLDMAGMVYNGATMSQPGDPEYVALTEATSNLFSVFGVPLYRGRAFRPEEDRLGGTPVAILGYSFWQRHFAGDPSALGATLVLDGKRRTIVGIAPPHFGLDDYVADVYTPMGQDGLPYMQNRGPHPVTTIARLRPGVTLVQAQAELALLGRDLAERYPKSNQGRGFLAAALRPDVGDVRSTLWLLLGAVSLVLLIACVNIASLLLARAVSRERELAMRVALGAGRGRLVGQCLTESAVLGISGGLLGVALAALGIRPFVAFWPGSLPRAEEVYLDWRVLLFAVALSLACGLFFGVAPALRVPTRQLEQVLRAGARTVPGSSRRWHGGFVVAEIALAVVLLVSAGMLGSTLLRVSALDPGVNVRNVLIARMALSPATLADTARTRAAWQDVLDRARRMPGVEAVATVDTVPMREGYNQIGYWTTPDVPPDNRRPMALATSVTPDYLKVMGIPLRAGRFFNDHDRMGSEPVIVIDDVMAQHAFGGTEAVGRRLWMPDMGPGASSFMVIGVVGHVRHWGLAADDQAAVRDQFYYPFAQVADVLVRRWSELMSIAVRTSIPPLAVVQPLRRELRGDTGDQVIYEARTMEQLARATLDRQRFLALLFGIFAGLALLLACIGIYGVLAYLTSRRVPEIGVRMALGATARDVVRLVLRQSLGMILGGVVIGAAAVLAVGRVLQRLVEGMRPTEPLTVVLMIAVLMAAALFASFLPARRAGRIDPMRALREE